jgi:SAM-dependent methyltransferase
VGRILAALCVRSTRALFRVTPGFRLVVLRSCLRLYQALYAYINLVAADHLGGRSPKHVYEWGITAWFLDRVAHHSRVLDIGCGTGALSKRLAEKAAIVVAYDRNAGAVRALARHSPRNVVTFQGDAIDALPRGRFHTAVLSSVLPFVRDPHELLSRLHDTADELLIRETRKDRDVTVPLMAELGMTYRSDPAARREYTKHELLVELDRAGWTPLETEDTYDIFVRARPATSRD